MKKNVFFILFFTALILCGCTKSDKNEDIVPQNGDYIGTLTVDQNDGTIYTDSDIAVEIIINADTSLDIIMKEVKFSSKMPVTLDMTIKNVQYTINGKVMVLSGTDLIPWAMGGEFPRYTITDLTGSISNQDITMEMSCGGYPLEYNGSVLSIE